MPTCSSNPTSSSSSIDPPTLAARRPRPDRPRAFTLVELLVVLAITALLAGLLLPALSRTLSRAQSIACLNNNRQLALAWMLYADLHQGRLPYNVAGAGTSRGIGARSDLNWANGILDWELTPDNTNSLMLTRSGLGPFVTSDPRVYRCPSDHVLSTLQRRAGWNLRVRSYSMNAMMGDAGEASATGINVNNPTYLQFFLIHNIPTPSTLFLFVDEHPDSINDGYFLNRGDRPEWIDLPASYHNRAATLSFADGHAQAHRWIVPSTSQPAKPDAAPLPLPLAPTETADWRWLRDRTSVSDPHDPPDGYGSPW
jgi:prepilin-type N-terminal cleavage/methylation domain-containing protein/prepilin-type processing-associated H-X9-DG protein